MSAFRGYFPASGSVTIAGSKTRFAARIFLPHKVSVSANETQPGAGQKIAGCLLRKRDWFFSLACDNRGMSPGTTNGGEDCTKVAFPSAIPLVYAEAGYTVEKTPRSRTEDMPSTQFSGRARFGLLPEPERNPASFLTSCIINGAVLTLLIVFGTVAHHELQLRKMESTEIVFPTTPPPEIKVKVKMPPQPKLPPIRSRRLPSWRRRRSSSQRLSRNRRSNRSRFRKRWRFR